MTDKEFINQFKEIKITTICKELDVNYHNVACGRAGYETTKKVANELQKKIENLLKTRNKNEMEYLDI